MLAVDYRWRVLIAVGFGTYMATMDFSIVNIALPSAHLAEAPEESGRVALVDRRGVKDDAEIAARPGRWRIWYCMTPRSVENGARRR